jgi:hypothetical protein
MHCLLCGKKLPFLRKLKNGDFCSEAHQDEFQREQNQAAVSRLLAAASVEDVVKSKRASAKLEAQPETPPKAPPPVQEAAKPVPEAVKAAAGNEPAGRTPAGKRGARKSQGKGGEIPAAAYAGFFPYAFSWIEWTGRGMQFPVAKPTRPRYRLVVPALDQKSGRRLPPAMHSLLALALNARTPDREAIAAAEAAAAENGLGPALPVTRFPIAGFPWTDAGTDAPAEMAGGGAVPAGAAEAPAAALVPHELTPAPPPSAPPAGAPRADGAPAAPGDLAAREPWAEGWITPNQGQLSGRPLWALPAAERPDWRPRNLPALDVELQSDPRTDPYAAARSEGCELLAIAPPKIRRNRLFRPVACEPAGKQGDPRTPAESKRETLLPATPGGSASGLRRGRTTTVSLTQPVSGRYRWIALFPRHIDSRPRCRAPRVKTSPVFRALPRGSRTVIELPFAGVGPSVVWLTSPPLPLPAAKALFPHLRPPEPEFRQPLGGLQPLFLHPKTRTGTEVLHGDGTTEAETLAAPPVRHARLSVALQKDWLTVAAGPVPMELRVDPQPMRPAPQTGTGGSDSPTALAPRKRVTAHIVFRSVVAARRQLAKPSRRMLPLSLDEMTGRDWKASCRLEAAVTVAAAPAPVRASGLKTRWALLESTARSAATRWGFKFQRLAGRWQQLPAPIRWSGPLMALVAAVALVGPSGLLSSAPDFEAVNGGSAEPVEVASTAGAGVAVAAKPERRTRRRIETPAAEAPPRFEPASVWNSIQQKVSDRAAVALTDDFRSGLSAWTGYGNWARSWSYDAAGFVRTGPLALYTPSMELIDYRAEFLGQIERRSLGWTLRAADLRNYYACKLTIATGGPLPKVNLVRYRVTNGVAGPARVKELPMQVQPDTVYRVLSEVRGSSFTVSVQGMIIDSWDDEKLSRGGVGFFSGPGELARIRWVGVWHQYDFLGRLCAFLAPAGPRTNRTL